MYVYADIGIYVRLWAFMCVYYFVYACICMYVHVFDFMFCTRRKREKVAQARTWCPAMCFQKANERAAKPLGRFWDSNTCLHSDMCSYVPLSQLWLWHYWNGRAGLHRISSLTTTSSTGWCFGWWATSVQSWPHSGHSGGAVDLTVPEPLWAFLHALTPSMVQGLKRPLRLCSKAVTASKILYINYDF